MNDHSIELCNNPTTIPLQYFICYNNPESHPFITEKEKNYLSRELGKLKRRDDLPPTPWRSILTCPATIALIFAQIGHNWGLFIIINDLPKYMNDVLRFSIEKNGLYTSLPYVVLWIVALLTGFLSDFLIKRKYLGITASRKLFTSIGEFDGKSNKKWYTRIVFFHLFTAAIGPGVFVVLASYAGCNRVAVVAMFTIGMGLMGTFYSGIKANSLDIAPNYAGVIMGIANGTGLFSLISQIDKIMFCSSTPMHARNSQTEISCLHLQHSFSSYTYSQFCTTKVVPKNGRRISNKSYMLHGQHFGPNRLCAKAKCFLFEACS